MIFPITRHAPLIDHFVLGQRVRVTKALIEKYPEYASHQNDPLYICDVRYWPARITNEVSLTYGTSPSWPPQTMGEVVDEWREGELEPYPVDD